MRSWAAATARASGKLTLSALARPWPLGARSNFNQRAHIYASKDPDINFDTKGRKWTRSVRFGEFGTLTARSRTSEYYVLSLDANQLGCAHCERNTITGTDMQIYIGSDPNFANPGATSTGVDGTG